jgi:uncharacterized protein (DUF983 family)
MTHAATPELDAEERPFWPAVRRGWHRRCPDCGQGPMMRGYLTVRDSCPVCGCELHHHRADDGPAYVTILIVGHILAPLILFVYSNWRPEPWTMVAMFSTGTVALSLFLLPSWPCNGPRRCTASATATRKTTPNDRCDRPPSPS